MKALAVIQTRFGRYWPLLNRLIWLALSQAAFGAEVRSEVELDRLSQQLLGVVDDTLQPAHVGVWLRPLARRLPAED